MVDKGKKGKPGATAAAAAAAAAPGAAPPPGDEVGRWKGWCRRYKLEVKNSNREFWLNGYAEVKLIILVSGPVSLGGAGGGVGSAQRRAEGGAGSPRPPLARALCRGSKGMSPGRAA